MREETVRNFFEALELVFVHSFGIHARSNRFVPVNNAQTKEAAELDRNTSNVIHRPCERLKNRVGDVAMCI